MTDYKTKDLLIEEIIKLEWHAFQHVQNEGGRASCQDEHETFYIMRKSQYLCWPENLLKSYLNDFINANHSGWNLIAEKYARMEEYTSPERFEALKPLLPVHTDEQKNIINRIVTIQNAWAEDFYRSEPEIAARSRTVQHNSSNLTSSAVYLTGELGTYSLETLKLYEKWIHELIDNKINLVEETVKNTLKLYRTLNK